MEKLTPEDISRELIGLDYVLTWNYTPDYQGDLKRYQYLVKLKNRNEIIDKILL